MIRARTHMRVGRSRAAFTLLELIVITVILVLLVAASIPAFAAILSNTRASLADSSLRVGLANGREAAIRSENRKDSAAVFFFRPGGQVSIVACREVGELRSRRLDGRVETVSVFVPDPFFDPITLPRNWHVRAFTPSGSITTSGDIDPYRWYSTDRYPQNESNWVFPETHFYDDGGTVPGDAGFARQTFMVRFDGGTGKVSPVRSDALVLDPVAENDFRDPDSIWGAREENRADRQTDRARFVRQLLARKGLPGSLGLTEKELEDLLGDRATDTILARPVRQLALYDVRELAREITGASLDDTRTGSLYAPARNQRPVFEFAQDVNERIDGVAEFFTVERQSGQAVRLPEPED